MKSESKRTMIVCIDSYNQSVPQGRFYNLAEEDAMPFQSLTQLLGTMESKLNETKFPQAFDAIRTFGLPWPADSSDEVEEEPRQGSLATFALRILFRQNASWQGSVTWLEGGQEESFRSALELIFLMDSALTQNTS